MADHFPINSYYQATIIERSEQSLLGPIFDCPTAHCISYISSILSTFDTINSLPSVLSCA